MDDDSTTKQVKAFLHKGCPRSALMVVLADKLAKPALATIAAVAVSYTPALSTALRAMTKLFG